MQTAVFSRVPMTFIFRIYCVFNAGRFPLTKNGEPFGSPNLCKLKWWVEMDSNQRKLTLADLQSAPFSHSGIYPFRFTRGRMYEEGGLF